MSEFIDSVSDEDDGIPIEVEDEPTQLPQSGPSRWAERFDTSTFRRELDREYARSKRYGHALSILLLDVDHLARYNRQHGAERGDELLDAVAAMLTATLRAPDLICRIGGDDFAIVATDTSEEQGMALAERLLERVGELGDAEGLPPFTASIGIASCPSPRYARAWDLVDAAELALAAAKRAGRNSALAAE